MPHYAIHMGDGAIVRTLTIREDDLALNLQEGEVAFECDPLTKACDRIDVATGTVVQQPEPVIDEGPAWAWARRKAYGSPEFQLGALYAGMKEHGVPHPAFQKWFDTITAVKQAIPKDITQIPDAVWPVDPTDGDTP